MDDCKTPREPRCDCELPGLFRTGVPGILARVENGRLVPGAKVERCDLCQQYPSDEAALAKLRELGVAYYTEDAETYTVQAFVTVRVPMYEIMAYSPREAAAKARDLFRWPYFRRQAECDQGLHEFLVEVPSDPDDSRSVRFNRELEELPDVTAPADPQRRPP
jgi:hypothetical protein